MKEQLIRTLYADFRKNTLYLNLVGLMKLSLKLTVLLKQGQTFA